MSGAGSSDEQTRRLIARHDQERNKLAGDLHDGLLQYVIAARMMTEAARRRLASQHDRSTSELEAAEQHLQRAVAEGRRLIRQLTFGNQEVVDLADELQELVRQLNSEGQVACELQVDGDLDVPPAARLALLRVAQEAISNVRRHSQATSASIIVRRQPEALVLTVQDNGIGFDLNANRPNHFGLTSMQSRVESIGGHLEIKTNPTTEIKVTLPYAST